VNRARPFLRSIRARVALAMLLPLAVALGVAGWASLASVTSTVKERERERIEAAHELLGQIALAIVASSGRPQFLDHVASSLGGEILLHDRNRGAIQTTLDGNVAEGFRELARSGALRERAPPGAPSALRSSNAPWLVLNESVGGHDIFLIYPGDPVRDAAARARRPMLIAGSVALVLATALAFLLASFITRPLKRLASEAAIVAEGDLDREVTVVSRDETGDLAASFNLMLAGLRGYRAELVQAERMAILGRIASAIAHELRNPLTAIRMNVQMLPAEEDATAREEEAALILEEIGRLERTVDDLLSLSRTTPMTRTDVDVGDLVRSTIELMDRQMEHLHVRVEVDADEMPPLRADETRLRQVLLNLLLNAAQAMPEGGLVSVKIRAVDEGVRISLTDTGGGVPPDIAPGIFEPFVSGRPGGTGLGLAICQQIVAAHGGTIAFRDTGHGTVFDVTIPSRPDRSTRDAGP
jgi:signal transduction histidine kinase